MAMMTFRGTLDPQETVYQIKGLFPSTGLTVELVDEAHKLMNGSEVHLLVFEKFFYRVSNRVSLSVMITHEQGVTDVYAVGSGAGRGAIFNIGWGSEEDLVTSFSNIIESLGFVSIAS